MAKPPVDPGGGGGVTAKKARKVKKSKRPPFPRTLPPPWRGELPPQPPKPPPPGSLGIPDLPPDIEATVAKILAQDPTNGVAIALAYIRGTGWYKQAYAGIGLGITSGLFGGGAPEADYRAYVTSVKDTFQRTYGRPPTAGELGAFMKSGFSTTRVEQVGQGHAWVQANSPDVQYELGAFDKGQLSAADLQTLGEQQAGVTSTAGSRLQARLEAAGAKMQRLFEGVLAQPSFTLGSGGLSAPSLGTKQKPDISA